MQQTFWSADPLDMPGAVVAMRAVPRSTGQREVGCTVLLHGTSRAQAAGSHPTILLEGFQR